MRTMHAGPLVAGYENGFLRRIRYGDTEVIRMIYFALRDRNWNTLESRIENEKISAGDNRFLITYDCINLSEGLPIMEWKVKLEGTPEGVIIFEVNGTMLETFQKNRAGFCILHPLNVAGRNCTLTHPDGNESVHAFPVAISPINPFLQIQAMTWDADATTFHLEFEGDTFETEDQRNWGDASYKTFCTPLDKPFPAELKKGESVYQKITFRPVAPLQPLTDTERPITLRSTTIKTTLPLLGICASTQVKQLSEKAIANIRALRLSYYRIEVHPASETWVTDFSDAYETAYALGIGLEVVLHLTQNYKEEIEAFSVLCQQNKVRLKKVLLLDAYGMVTGKKIIAEVPALKRIFPRVLFGAGTNYNFNEINKNHFAPEEIDFISLSFDPQEHAFDDLTILENVGTLPHVVHSTKAIYGGGMPVHLSPITLRKRFNPYATNPSDLFIPEARKADPRQTEVFCAVWTFGTILGLTRGGAHSTTFFQTVGNQGILSSDGDPYPVYKVLKQFAPFQGKSVTVLDSSDPIAVEGMVINDKVLALVNYATHESMVRWDNLDFKLEPYEMRFVPLNRPQ
ncbi:MAG TPA: hypothetical protein VFT90_00130 [Chryseosolibacter sp.]|nr:hypothetical protein [Chryseosolibacter sp.]